MTPLSSPPLPPPSTPHPPPLQNLNSLILSNTKLRNSPQAFTTLLKDEFTLTTLLKASSLLPEPTLGQQLHARSLRTGLAADPGIRTSLIAMYSSHNLLHLSSQVFDEIPPSNNSDVPSWNSIISAYALHGHHTESFRLFSAMITIARLTPSVATYTIMIGACTALKEVALGRRLHARIIKERMVDELRLLNSMITLYSKCGELRDARKIFDAMDRMNIVSWNAMISGYEQNGEFECALWLFRRLLIEKTVARPNRITLLSVLSAVSSVLSLRAGKEVHAQIVRSGLGFETSIGNSLVTMYGRCGDMVTGRLVFDRMPSCDVITWNSMLVGYTQNEQSENCLELFRRMQSMNIEPDDHTLTLLLGAVSSESYVSGSCRLGREIHGFLLRKAVPKLPQLSASNAVITMYSNSGRIGDAKKIFDAMVERDSYTWNAMMDGYSTSGCCDEAVQLFIDLLDQGARFDHLTFSILLTACGRLASMKLGKQFHAFIIKYQFHLSNSEAPMLSVSNALVSMYSKCGSIGDAAIVFQRMAKKDVFSWTAIITGFAHHGMACESLRLFEMMKRDGIKPNSITFLALLTACAHAGLVEEGTKYFSLMSRERGKEPSVEHYAGMVDLFGRSGQLGRAEAMVEAGIAQLAPEGISCLPLWKVLLGACHAQKHLELGKRAATKILEIEPEDETTHVLLSNLYAKFGLWKDAINVRKRMRDRGLKKEAGCSWVEVENRRHVFVAGDVCHPNRKEIYSGLRELDEKCRAIGYAPMTEFVLHDVDEVQKEAILGCHSEKLAVSFVILSRGAANGVIRVIKNLRVCGDCHNWMKFVSQVEGREILLRDSRRFHSFRDGHCSCGDYW